MWAQVWWALVCNHLEQQHPALKHDQQRLRSLLRLQASRHPRQQHLTFEKKECGGLQGEMATVWRPRRTWQGLGTEAEVVTSGQQALSTAASGSNHGQGVQVQVPPHPCTLPTASTHLRAGAPLSPHMGEQQVADLHGRSRHMASYFTERHAKAHNTTASSCVLNTSYTSKDQALLIDFCITAATHGQAITLFPPLDVCISPTQFQRTSPSHLPPYLPATPLPLSP